LVTKANQTILLGLDPFEVLRIVGIAEEDEVRAAVDESDHGDAVALVSQPTGRSLPEVGLRVVREGRVVAFGGISRQLDRGPDLQRAARGAHDPRTKVITSGDYQVPAIGTCWAAP
jgi:hypothetical protein